MNLEKEKPVSVNEIINISRENYTRPTTQVEKDILRWSTGMDLDENEDDDAEDFNQKVLSEIGKNHKKETFSVNCAVCGKEEQIPFKPVNGKPVYCLSCYKKVQDGIIPPAPDKPKKISKSKIIESQNALASVGIEFEAEKKSTILKNKKQTNFKRTKKINLKQKKNKKTNEQMKNALKDILKDLEK